MLKNCPEFIAECRSVTFPQGSQRQAVDKSASVCVRDSFRLSFSERDQSTVSTTVDTRSDHESTRSSENEQFSQARGVLWIESPLTSLQVHKLRR